MVEIVYKRSRLSLKKPVPVEPVPAVEAEPVLLPRYRSDRNSLSIAYVAKHDHFPAAISYSLAKTRRDRFLERLAFPQEGDDPELVCWKHIWWSAAARVVGERHKQARKQRKAEKAAAKAAQAVST